MDISCSIWVKETSPFPLQFPSVPKQWLPRLHSQRSSIWTPSKTSLPSEAMTLKAVRSSLNPDTNEFIFVTFKTIFFNPNAWCLISHNTQKGRDATERQKKKNTVCVSIRSRPTNKHEQASVESQQAVWIKPGLERLMLGCNFLSTSSAFALRWMVIRLQLTWTEKIEAVHSFFCRFFFDWLSPQPELKRNFEQLGKCSSFFSEKEMAISHLFFWKSQQQENALKMGWKFYSLKHFPD